MSVHRSRWGFHPCDYQSYLLLKKLNLLYEKALRGFAVWQRWARKKPENRVMRRYRRNEQGQKVGSTVLGPWPEPALCPLFCTRAAVRHISGTGNGRTETRGDVVRMADWGIPAAYRAARMPVPSAEMVPPLAISVEEIRRLAAEADRWLEAERPKSGG